MNIHRFVVARLSIAICGSLLAACGSAPPAAPPELAVAASIVQEAERTGAAQYAPVELNRARDKIAAARAALQRDDYPDAQRLASEAEADAKLSALKAQASQAEQAASAVRQDQSVLRNQTMPPAAAAPANVQ
jgi:hypothetical protein